jgi:hypothetical protein
MNKKSWLALGVVVALAGITVLLWRDRAWSVALC